MKTSSSSSRLTSLRRIDKSALLISVLTFILATNFIAQTQAQTLDRRAKKRSTSTEATRLWSHDSLDEDSGDGGFVLDDHVLDIMEEEERVREEMKKAEKEQAKRPKSIFDSTTSCPYSFFPCQNGECLSPKWRCDGHYDCDDLSDELNCTNNTANTADDKTPPIKPISGSPIKPATPSSTPSSGGSGSSTDKAAQSPEDKSEIKFNSMLEPMMLFSTGVSIRGYWMRSRIYFDIYSKNAKPRNENPTITQALSIFFDLLNIERQSSPSTSTSGSTDSDKSRSTIVGVDMDHYEKEVFWVELGKDPGVYSTLIDSEQFESRYQRRQLAPPIRTVIDSGLLSPEDVALDSTSKNIYITDAGLPAIVVCSVKHSHCKILLSNDLHKPRALIIDSSTGWLTYTDWGDHPGIYLLSMDGSKRETLINTDIIWPNGLAADYQANQLYWADARLKKIERLDLSTKKRKVLVKEEASNPFSLSMFENRIYWSDWSGSDILTCDKVSGNDTRTVMHTDNIYGIHIYHPSNYPKSSELDNPCWSMRCSHLCLLSPTATSYDKRKGGQVVAQCACPESMTLGIDKSTCYEVQLSFLLVNVKNYIAQVFPERIGLRTIEKLLHSKDHTIQDVAADWTNFRIFFYDFSKKHIYLMDLTKRNAKPELFLTSTVSVRSLIYDSWSDNLYWLDSDQAALCMCSVSGKVETVLRRDMIAKPVSMVLDSKNRVFYLALAEPHTAAHIMRTDIMANEHSDLLIVDEDVGLPIAMHLDEQLQRLYYADAIHETIESVDLDVKSVRGWKAHSRIVHRKRLGAVLAFAVYNDYFLWTIKNGDYLYKAKIVNLNPLTQKPDNSRPIGLKLPKSATAKESNAEAKRLIMVDPTREAEESLCEKLSCSHGCIVGADMNGTCICPEGYVLQSPKNVDCQEAESIIHPAAAFIAAGDSGKEVEAKRIDDENSMVWLIVLLLLLSISGLIVVLGLLIMYRQGKLPRQVSQLSVSFSSSSHDKDGAMLLLDNDT